MVVPLRVGIVGVGWAGRRQAEAAREVPESVEIAALMDNDAGHLAATAHELGVERTTTDLEALLADPNLDAISICTPHGLHEPQALAAMAAGKHVLVEKPMATTVAAATRMVDAAEAAGVTLFVAEHLPYEARIGELRRMVQTREHIGELTFAACVAGYRAPSPAYDGRRAWLTDPDAGGTGTWMLQGVHTVAALRHVLGEVRSVYLLDHRASSFERPDLEATMSGTVVLESGVAVWLVQTTETALKPMLTGFRLYGDAGVVVATDEGMEIFEGDPREGHQPRRKPYPQAARSPYAEELRAFADTVAGRAEGPTTGVSERRTLAVIEAGVESARSGQVVDLRARYHEIWSG